MLRKSLKNYMSHEIRQAYCRSTTVIRAESYLDTPKAVLEVLTHFTSAIRSLHQSPAETLSFDERATKGTFLALSLEPFDGLLNLLATFKACNFKR